jgi:hypothetical protein
MINLFNYIDKTYMVKNLFKLFDEKNPNLILSAFYDEALISDISHYLIGCQDKDVFIYIARRDVTGFDRAIHALDFKYNVKNVKIVRSLDKLRGVKIDILIISESVMENENLSYMIPLFISMGTKVIWMGCTYRKGIFYNLYNEALLGKNDFKTFFYRWDVIYKDHSKYSHYIMEKASKMEYQEWSKRYNLEWD